MKEQKLRSLPKEWGLRVLSLWLGQRSPDYLSSSKGRPELFRWPWLAGTEPAHTSAIPAVIAGTLYFGDKWSFCLFPSSSGVTLSPQFVIPLRLMIQRLRRYIRVWGFFLFLKSQQPLSGDVAVTLLTAHHFSLAALCARVHSSVVSVMKNISHSKPLKKDLGVFWKAGLLMGAVWGSHMNLQEAKCYTWLDKWVESESSSWAVFTQYRQNRNGVGTLGKAGWRRAGRFPAFSLQL